MEKGKRKRIRKVKGEEGEQAGEEKDGNAEGLHDGQMGGWEISQ
jgi:hypothetical protein